MTDPAGQLEQGDLWLGHEVAARLLELPDGRAVLGLLRPIFVPVMLWRVLALGPRPQRRADAVQVLVDAGVTGVEQLFRDARAQASWAAPGGPPGLRVVRVLDNAAGLWQVTAEGDRARLARTTASAVWRELAGVLPTDSELPFD